MVNIKLSHVWRATLVWRPAGLGADPVNARTIHYPLIIVQTCTFLASFFREGWDTIVEFMTAPTRRFNTSSGPTTSKVSPDPPVEVSRTVPAHGGTHRRRHLRASAGTYPSLSLGLLAGIATLTATAAGWTGAGVPGIFLAIISAISTIIVTIWIQRRGDP